MSKQSFSQWYTTNDPTNGLEGFLGLTKAQLHPDQQYQASNFLEDRPLASVPSTLSSWESNLVKGHYVELPLAQPHYPPAAYQYRGVDAHNVSPAQWSPQPRKAEARVAASLPEGQPRSKRAKRRAEVLKGHGSVSATDQPRGKTRIISGVLEWFHPKLSTFHTAAPLDEYRRQIISEDNARGDYDYPPDQGLHEDDITSFPLHDPLGQQYWNLEVRDAWVDVKDEDGNQVLYLVSILHPIFSHSYMKFEP